MTRATTAWAHIDALPAALVVYGADGVVAHVNPAAERLFGRRAAELRGLALPLVPPPDQAATLAYLASVLAGQLRGPAEQRGVRGDGALLDMEMVASPARPPGAPATDAAHVVAAYTDITARKSMERVLLESEARYQDAVENGGVGVWHWELADDVIEAPPAYFRILGHPPTPRPRARTFFIENVHPEDRAALLAALERHLAGAAPYYHVEFRFRGADGQHRWIEATAVALRDAAGRPLRIRGTCQDVTARRLAQDAVRVSEARYIKATEGAGVGIWQWEFATDALTGTPRYAAILGHPPEALAGGSAFFRAHLDPAHAVHHRAALEAHLATDAPFAVELRFRGADGRWRWVEIAGSAERDAAGEPVRMMGTARDITAQVEAAEALRAGEETRRALAHQLALAQKMEALGTLAGGIAHDFNNILGAIIGFAELARLDVPADSAPAHHLEEITRASARATRLVAQILAFSRQAPAERAPVAIADVLQETRSLLRATLPASIRLEVRCAPDVGHVDGDATQLQQVLLNLAANAEHAMRRTGGVLALEVTREDASAGREGGPAAWVCLRVRDTGPGLAPDVAARAFEPFFTTKPVGEGTGMGLAVVHGIVSAHGGTIALRDAPARGAEVEIRLPARPGDAAAAPPPPAADPAPRRRPELPAALRGAHLLVVDDEPMLVTAWERLGARLGLRVTGLTSPLDARARVAADPGAFDVVLTDQSMPGLSGEELARDLLALRPDLPILLCTGNSLTVDPERAAAVGIRAVLYKPVSARQLAEALVEVLTAGAPLSGAPSSPR